MSRQGGAIEEMFRRARLPELIGETTLAQVRKTFPDDTDFDRWLDGLERLIAAEIGCGAVINFALAGVASGKTFGPGVANRIARLVKNAKVSRPVRLRGQAQGDRLDLDACILTAIDHRIGVRPDPRVYETRIMRARDLSVLALLDISESTHDRIKDTTSTVIQVERAAVALLSEAIADLGDPFAVHAFCSNGREEVRTYCVKDFRQPYDDAARARLAELRGGLSTRLGAALRHAGAEVAYRRSHRRLILVVTDGEPSDVDIADRNYLVEDARKAVQDLAHGGIDVFCVDLVHSGGENYLPRIFGRRGFVTIQKIEALPEKLPMLYFRMTV
ncbi:nitric oxide reductase activation protein NorD [Mesorhizobium shangrilense]|uniref:VWA domain-containing protein n=1 Tax=Mesorhizobium shangrilense TaxID=460060 RepID=A0ABV2DM76_9HYPH